MSLIKSSCSATHTKAPTSPTRRVPMVRVDPKSAIGAASAGPNTAWRAKGRCLAGSHRDWEATRYRRPPTWRSNIFILSSSHDGTPMSSEGAILRVSDHPRSALSPQMCESRASTRIPSAQEILSHEASLWNRLGIIYGLSENNRTMRPDKRACVGYLPST